MDLEEGEEEEAGGGIISMASANVQRFWLLESTCSIYCNLFIFLPLFLFSH